MTLEQLTENVKRLPDMLGRTLGEVLRHHETDVMDFQHRQLCEGKDSDDNDIRPLYSEDLKPRGYFITRESAARYAAWKETLNTPYHVERNTDAPNLFITGKFYSEMGVKFNDETMEIVPKTGYASGIMAKYGRNTFGLSMRIWNEFFFERGIKDEFIINVKNLIYGN